jgi:pimeloyl-ACP methyl ester carboxylesterase
MITLHDPVMPTPPSRVGATRLPDGRLMGWAEFGDPSGDPVLWFHGTPGGRCQVPSDVHDEAMARRLRIIGVERPGTGDSTVHHYDQIVDFVDDVVVVMDDLGIDRFAAIGLSGGGPYVLACAARLGDRMTTGVVLGGIGPTRGADAVFSHTLLLAAAAGLLEKVRQPIGNAFGRIIQAVAPIGAPAIDAFFWIEWGDRRDMTAKPGCKTQLIADLVDAARRGGIETPLDDLSLFGRHWGFELHEVKVPITFFGGTSDVIVPYMHAERQAKRVEGSTLRTVPGTGHFAGWTKVDQVLDEVRAAWPPVRPARPAAAKRPAKRAPRRAG